MKDAKLQDIIEYKNTWYSSTMFCVTYTSYLFSFSNCLKSIMLTEKMLQCNSEMMKQYKRRMEFTIPLKRQDSSFVINQSV